MREVFSWATRGVLGSHLHTEWLMEPKPLIHSSGVLGSVQFGEVDFDWSREPNLYGVCSLMSSSGFKAGFTECEP